MRRRLPIVTGLTGLLVVAAADSVLHERALGVIATASAQESEEEFDDEEYLEDESAAEDESQTDEDASWEEEEESSDESATDDSDVVEIEQPTAPEETAQPANDAAPASKRDRAFQAIVESTKDVLPALEGHVFKPSDRLRDLGANSVERSEIVMMTLERLAVSVPLMEFARVETISDLAASIAAKLP
ncbi:MAG: acyl carrier protein [Rhodanobacteraceae bacterium]|nr:acyl carrier protein [Rhodanobacteraceae bacterium]